MTMSKKREQEQELLTDAIFDKIEETGMTIGDVELGKEEGGSTGNWGWSSNEKTRPYLKKSGAVRQDIYRI